MSPGFSAALARLGMVVAATALLGVAPASAQRPDQVPLNARVRIKTAGPPPIVHVGIYQGLTAEGLALSGPTPLTVPLGGIERLEWYRGRKPGLLGGVAGFVVGGLAGGLAACAANRDSYGVFCAGQNDTKLVIGAAVGGAVGAVVGALLFRRDRWVVVDPGRLSPARP